MGNLIPYIIEKTADGERSYDLYSRLLKDRIIFISGTISQDSMIVAASELLFLNSEDNKKPISMYISSPGGDVIEGLGTLIDTMNFISAPVYTFALGMAASMGGAILSAGAKGHRYAMRSSQILVHPMTCGFDGRTVDNIAEINYEKRLNDYLLSTIAHNCGQMDNKSYNEVYSVIQNKIDDRNENQQLIYSKDTSRQLNAFKQNNNYDHWMFAEEAKKFGIIDQILDSEEDIKL